VVRRTVWTCCGSQRRHINIEDVPEEYNFFPHNASVSSIDIRRPRAAKLNQQYQKRPLRRRS
jgi:hypothetical protein